MPPLVRRYRALGPYLRERFGARVRSVTIDAGFTCPNVDGTVTTGGCVYCDNRTFSPNRRLPRSTVRAQVERGVEILSARYNAEKFIAYFQAATNTHAAVEKLRRLYDEAIDHPLVIGLAIGTRPDSVPDEVLNLLDEFAARLPVWLEVGLQTIHDRSLDWMNRGHHYDAFLDAVARCRGRGFELSTHVILGLPGESHADMMATADAVASMPLSSIKVHNLYAVTGTPLADMVERGEVRLLERDEYVGLICDFLERLPPEMVVHRLQGEAPPEFLVGPKWCLDKERLLAAIDAELVRRDSRQGVKWVPQEVETMRRADRVSLPMIAG
jgi:radical SAM protein (TIGR01212 family)